MIQNLKAISIRDLSFLVNELSKVASTGLYKIVADEPQFLLVSKYSEVSIHSETNSDNKNIGLIQQLRMDFSRDDLLPVHRLDKSTSGLLLVGKGSENTRILSELFQQRRITKLYWALAAGKPSKKQGKIVGDLEKTRGGSYKLSHSRKKPSITQFYSYSLSPGLRAYLLKPLTGKTHQLRVVMKSLGTPILGDQRYGGASKSVPTPSSGSNRLCLHAAALGFNAFGMDYQFEEMPDFHIEDTSSFEKLVQELGSVFNVSFPILK